MSLEDHLKKGQVVFKHYCLERRLGGGGMGEVWLATKRNANDLKVALKFPYLEFPEDERNAIEELRKEAANGMRMTGHPNIVKVFNFLEGEDASDKLIAILMEYVAGSSLRDLLALKKAEARRPFSVEEVSAWLPLICEGLDSAHLRDKVIHRDLKPANILIGISDDEKTVDLKLADRLKRTNGDVKITDFGLARSIESSLSQRTLTRHHSGASGTEFYMSPQQLYGLTPSPSDDIYALGICLFELLAGKPPFVSGAVVQQIEKKKAPSIGEKLVENYAEYGANYARDIPQLWEEVIAACLDKKPEKRPHCAAEVASRLGLVVKRLPAAA